MPKKPAASSQQPAAKHGFTLIELLVVIGVIGMLTGIVVIGLAGAQARARDAKRISELKQLQTALQQYYQDNGSYPTPAGGSAYSSSGASWLPGIAPQYMKVLPQDPKPVGGACDPISNTGCFNLRYSSPAQGLCTTAGQTYFLVARLEGQPPKDYGTQQIVEGGAATACNTVSSTNGLYYVVNP